jgi:nucleoside-diphosphate-sugar epimerase
MRYLVTGGSGYFGALLRDRLLKNGKKVRVFDLVDTSDRPAAVEFVQGDIRQISSLESACMNCTAVFHCVAQVPLAKDRRLFKSVNVDGTENLLRVAKGAGIRKVVCVSSSAVYGAPKTNPVTEQTPPAPAEAYGRAKLEAENICRRYADEGLDVTIIRPRTILGHGRLGIFQILFEWIRGGYNIPVLGRGDNRYQFVHADDLADACLLSAERKGPSVYNCGTDRFGTMRASLEYLCVQAGTGSKVRSVPMGPATWLMRLFNSLGLSPLGPYHALMYGKSLYFDISKARVELGWAPRYSNEEMLLQSYHWYLEHRDEILGSHGCSHHKSAVKQGILSLVKRCL